MLVRVAGEGVPRLCVCYFLQSRRRLVYRSVTRRGEMKINGFCVMFCKHVNAHTHLEAYTVYQ